MVNSYFPYPYCIWDFRIMSKFLFLFVFYIWLYSFAVEIKQKGLWGAFRTNIISTASRQHSTFNHKNQRQHSLFSTRRKKDKIKDNIVCNTHISIMFVYTVIFYKQYQIIDQIFFGQIIDQLYMPLIRLDQPQSEGLL